MSKNGRMDFRSGKQKIERIQRYFEENSKAEKIDWRKNPQLRGCYIFFFFQLYRIGGMKKWGWENRELVPLKKWEWKAFGIGALLLCRSVYTKKKLANTIVDSVVISKMVCIGISYANFSQQFSAK